MSNLDRRIWPFTPRVGIISTGVLLIGLLLAVAILRATIKWPSEKSETAVLVGVVLLSLLPILLALIDVFIERGGVITVRGVTIDFSRVPQMRTSGATVPVNIGVRGQAVADSSTTEILDSLKQATSCEIVIIDLEDGQAWWETRLLVLLSGAERLGRPSKIVFVGTVANKEQQFHGWAHAEDLLRCLMHADPQYLRSLYTARAAARQWALVEPVNPMNTANPGLKPTKLPWIDQGMAGQFEWMAFDQNTGLPNELLAEQLLQNDLGEKIERKRGPKQISLVGLDHRFGSVLIKDRIDQDWPNEKQISTFLDTDAPYIAVTSNGRYSALVSRVAILNEMLKTLMKKKGS